MSSQDIKFEELTHDQIKDLFEGDKENKDPGTIDLRYGKHKGKTLNDMMKSREGISYLGWLKKTTTSDFMREAIKTVFNRKLASMSKN